VLAKGQIQILVVLVAKSVSALEFTKLEIANRVKLHHYPVPSTLVHSAHQLCKGSKHRIFSLTLRRRQPAEPTGGRNTPQGRRKHGFLFDRFSSLLLLFQTRSCA
jgi:hypothetical protein